MDIDKSTLKALSAETRQEILKHLIERRYMPSEISKIMKLAPSTVVEHLKKLEQADLVKREETGHKWVYYKLTDKGKNIVEPSNPMRFVLSLIGGVVLTGSSLFYYLRNTSFGLENVFNAVGRSAGDAAEAITEPVGGAGTSLIPPEFLILLALFGVAVIAVSAYFILKEKGIFR